MAKEYFPNGPITNPECAAQGWLTDYRAGLAFHLIEHFGSVAGKCGSEDSSGRARLELQSPEELVERCCRIAELTFEAFEARGWMKPLDITVEQAYSELGRMESIRRSASYRFDDEIDKLALAAAKKASLARGDR